MPHNWTCSEANSKYKSRLCPYNNMGSVPKEWVTSELKILLQPCFEVPPNPPLDLHVFGLEASKPQAQVPTLSSTIGTFCPLDRMSSKYMKSSIAHGSPVNSDNNGNDDHRSRRSVVEVASLCRYIYTYIYIYMCVIYVCPFL